MLTSIVSFIRNSVNHSSVTLILNYNAITVWGSQCRVAALYAGLLDTNVIAAQPVIANVPMEFANILVSYVQTSFPIPSSKLHIYEFILLNNYT
jgi:hypothetical protein